MILTVKSDGTTQIHHLSEDSERLVGVKRHFPQYPVHFHLAQRRFHQDDRALLLFESDTE